MDRHHLQAALGSARSQTMVAPGGNSLMPGRLQRRGMTEGVAAIVQGDEAVTLGAR